MSDLIKTYEGYLILPFGTPYIITTAWETKTQYHTQSLMFFECLDGSVELFLNYQPFAKDVPKGHLPGSLPKDKALKYALDYGYDMAYRSIPTALWNYTYRKLNTKKNLPNPSTLIIKLEETEHRELVVLSHLLRKDKKAFGWVENQVKSGVLAALMKTTKGLNIQSSQTYNNP